MDKKGIKGGNRVIDSNDIKLFYAIPNNPVESQKVVIIVSDDKRIISGKIATFVSVDSKIQSITLEQPNGKHITFNNEHIISIEEA